MKEQVITPRAGRSAVAAGKGRASGIPQTPTRRERGGASTSRAKTSGWRKSLPYLPLAGKITVAVVIGILLFAGYRAAASASFFHARSVDVSGTVRVSQKQVSDLVLGNVAQTGVWRADLDAISRELKRIAWVKEAVVSRVLPDGLRVRVTERQPLAVVRTAAGKFVWVDEDAVSLGAASPADQIFMRGWDEDGTEGARASNRQRVEKFLAMMRELEANGISRRVSEVNFGDLRDVRAQLTGDDSQVEIQLGQEDFGNRLKFALDELDRQRNTPIGPFILHINVAQGIEKGNHVTIGLGADAPNFSSAGNETSGPEVESAKVTARSAPAAAQPAEKRKPKEKETIARKEETQGRKKDQDKRDKEKKERIGKNKPAREAQVESRPRRVG
ncbi:MAG TPA: FtsQ-type POTRA domain-containing protein [Pyrinomonadaceae bacterium]|nr:FtsQ-type POTRA domain-containing protein [Pyrinomonadaceae bacterium]